MRFFIFSFISLIAFTCFATRFQVFKDKFYELDRTLQTLCVYSLTTKGLLASYPTGVVGVDHILIDPERHRLLVIHSRSRNLFSFDIDDLSAPKSFLRLPNEPDRTVIGGSHLFISNKQTNQIDVINLVTFTYVQSINIGPTPKDLYIHGEGLFVLIPGQIIEINCATLGIKQMTSVDPLAAVALANDQHLFTLSKSSSTLKVTDHQSRDLCWEFVLMRVSEKMLLVGDKLVILYGLKPKLKFIDCLTLSPLHSISFTRNVEDVLSCEGTIYVCYGGGQFVGIPILPRRESIFRLINSGEYMKYLPKSLNLLPILPANSVDLSSVVWESGFDLDSAHELVYDEIMQFFETRSQQMICSSVSKKFRYIFTKSRTITNSIFVDFIYDAWTGNAEQARKIFCALCHMGYPPAQQLKLKAIEEKRFGYK